MIYDVNDDIIADLCYDVRQLQNRSNDVPVKITLYLKIYLEAFHKTVLMESQDVYAHGNIFVITPHDPVPKL